VRPISLLKDFGLTGVLKWLCVGELPCPRKYFLLADSGGIRLFSYFCGRREGEKIAPEYSAAKIADLRWECLLP